MSNEENGRAVAMFCRGAANIDDAKALATAALDKVAERARLEERERLVTLAEEEADFHSNQGNPYEDRCPHTQRAVALRKFAQAIRSEVQG